jgi:hypothetical protein
MKSNSRPADAGTSGGSNRSPLGSRRTPTQSTVALRQRGVGGLPARRLFEDRRRWEGSAAALREDGTEFSARLAMTLRGSKTGMPIGFAVSSSDAMEEVRLTVQLHRTRADLQSALEWLPHALVIVNAVDEIRPANVDDELLSDYSHEGAGWSLVAVHEILRGHCHEGAGWSPVEILVADRYLDRHPGLRMGFFSESHADLSQAVRERSLRNQNGDSASYVCMRVGFARCCQLVRAMQFIWLPLDGSGRTRV